RPRPQFWLLKAYPLGPRCSWALNQSGAPTRMDATLKLPPGSHEIRVTAPTGASSTRLVSVTPQEAGSRKTISFPLGQTGVVEATTSVSQPEQPRRGKQTAAATAVVLLLVLAAAAYFVLRGPDRTRAQNTSVSAGLATATSPSAEPATRLAD